MSAVQLTSRRIRSQLRFAASGILGDIGQVVCVYPGQDDLHTLLVLQIGDETVNARTVRAHVKATAQTTLPSDGPGIALVDDHLKRITGSIGASPASFGTLSPEYRQAIQVAIRHTSEASDLDAMQSPGPSYPRRGT